MNRIAILTAAFSIKYIHVSGNCRADARDEFLTDRANELH